MIKSRKFTLREGSYGKECERKVAIWKPFQKMEYQLSKTNPRMLLFIYLSPIKTRFKSPFSWFVSQNK
jgi:hypothetical protein